ncbi:MAG: hypothetical protein ACYTE8_07085 [Planctomycetota bacterium]
MNVIFVFTTILHLVFAKTGWFYRYEAYLMVLAMFVLATSFSKDGAYKLLELEARKSLVCCASLAIVALIITWPFFLRGYTALLKVPKATSNIYRQQYQMGLFLRSFYEHQSVAVNDIGSVNYLADIKTLDLGGLTNLAVTESLLKGNFNTKAIQDLAVLHNIKIAIVYDDWYEPIGGVPGEWIQVGRWKILDNVVCGSDTVSFYAVQKSDEEELVNNLKSFSSFLPDNIEETGCYLYSQQ